MVKDEAVGGVDAELGFLASDAETTASWRHCAGWVLWTLGGTTTFVFSTGVGAKRYMWTGRCPPQGT